ncbi:condensation domain-containing protein, partial [Francisella philomiragia]|uniref:condensation domain-containing protein n=1 Tax=Francisella philomiragia TaxID=28110 RepID=UPI0019039B22
MKLLNLFRKNKLAIWVENNKLKAFFPTILNDVDKFRDLIRLNKNELLHVLLENKIKSKQDFFEKIILLSNLSDNPLSFAQERLWFIEQYDKDINPYFIPIFVSINEGVDIGAIKDSLISIVDRHEVLRSVFSTNDDGSDYQVILN